MAKLKAGSTIDGFKIYHEGDTNEREACLVYQTVAQGIAHATWTKVSFDSVRFDKLVGWDSVNKKYFVKKTGLFLIIGAVNWSNTIAGVRTVMDLQKNGGSYAWMTQEHSGAPKDFSTIGSIVLECNVGDTLELLIWQSVPDGVTPVTLSTSIIAYQGVPTASTFFNITRLG